MGRPLSVRDLFTLLQIWTPIAFRASFKSKVLEERNRKALTFTVSVALVVRQPHLSPFPFSFNLLSVMREFRKVIFCFWRFMYISRYRTNLHMEDKITTQLWFKQKKIISRVQQWHQFILLTYLGVFLGHMHSISLEKAEWKTILWGTFQIPSDLLVVQVAAEPTYHKFEATGKTI